MSEPIKKVTLEFPCREQWSKLEVIPGGRLCQYCVHVVRDFRDCTQSDLNSALKTQSHVCGIFNRNQLSPTFLKAAAIALAASTLPACETEQPNPATNDVVRQLSSSELDLPSIEDDTTYLIGIVITPLPDSVPVQNEEE